VSGYLEPQPLKNWTQQKEQDNLVSHPHIGPSPWAVSSLTYSRSQTGDRCSPSGKCRVVRILPTAIKDGTESATRPNHVADAESRGPLGVCPASHPREVSDYLISNISQQLWNKQSSQRKTRSCGMNRAAGVWDNLRPGSPRLLTVKIWPGESGTWTFSGRV
jgi:hypothetical protein